MTFSRFLFVVLGTVPSGVCVRKTLEHKDQDNYTVEKLGRDDQRSNTNTPHHNGSERKENRDETTEWSAVSGAQCGTHRPFTKWLFDCRARLSAVCARPRSISSTRRVQHEYPVPIENFRVARFCKNSNALRGVGKQEAMARFPFAIASLGLKGRLKMDPLLPLICLVQVILYALVILFLFASVRVGRRHAPPTRAIRAWAGEPNGR